MEKIGGPLHILYNRKAVPASVSINNRSYILVFPLKTIASKVHPYIHSSKQLHVTFDTFHKKERINEILSELDIDPRKYKFNHTYMDNEAHLHIKKLNKSQKPSCQLIQRSIVDIILYPLQKNIGLVIPYEILEETSDEMVLDSRLIEPADHVELFRRELESLV